MKRIIFLLLLVMTVMISCTKEKSLIRIDYQPKDSTFIRVDYKPMEKVLTVGERNAE